MIKRRRDRFTSSSFLVHRDAFEESLKRTCPASSVRIGEKRYYDSTRRRTWALIDRLCFLDLFSPRAAVTPRIAITVATPRGRPCHDRTGTAGFPGDRTRLPS